MSNTARHVIGEVNTECPPSWHTTTWGNWGVSSNFGGVVDGDQFRGWHLEGNQGQWNSCTRDHIRDTDNIYYNHDHNGNGLGDDQWQDGDHEYAAATADIYAGCPVDLDGDGICDAGGCLALNSGFSLNNQFMTLYELDWPDSDDLVTTLYADSECCQANPSCAANSCLTPVASPYSPTAPDTNASRIETKVRMVVKKAIFADHNQYCYNLGLTNPAYRCISAGRGSGSVGGIDSVSASPAESQGMPLQIQVRDKKTHAPVAASVVAVGTTPKVFTARTDQNGVAILRLPSLEHVSVNVRTDTHGEQCFGPGRTMSGKLKVELDPSVRVHGIVRDEEGYPLQSVQVKISYAREVGCRIEIKQPDVLTNEQGVYVLRNLDLSRRFRIGFLHDTYVEHEVTHEEFMGALPSVPSAQLEMDVNLSRQ